MILCYINVVNVGKNMGYIYVPMDVPGLRESNTDTLHLDTHSGI